MNDRYDVVWTVIRKSGSHPQERGPARLLRALPWLGTATAPRPPDGVRQFFLDHPRRTTQHPNQRVAGEASLPQTVRKSHLATPTADLYDHPTRLVLTADQLVT